MRLIHTPVLHLSYEYTDKRCLKCKALKCKALYHKYIRLAAVNSLYDISV